MRSLARRVVDRRVRTLLIDGPSGSGKSTFAVELLRAIRSTARAPEAALVRMDDLYPGWSGLDSAVVASHRELVRPHALGLASRWRPWNWAAGTTTGTRVVTAPLLLLEGCGAAGAANRARADLSVWIEASEQERRTRALARDGALFEPHWDDWDLQFRRYCDREAPRESADLVLDTGDGPCAEEGQAQPSSCSRSSSMP
ncbi:MULTISPECIES: ATP-binding protein [unclassified Rathayibacter]|uniref:ATP-binding protein n=1 Tax=unclassified Rathayibacter TaxID=2609250 RepID=UPI0019505863|nr:MULTISPECIES: ATP-binding protein [unclassified Rathayibacter]